MREYSYNVEVLKIIFLLSVISNLVLLLDYKIIVGEPKFDIFYLVFYGASKVTTNYVECLSLIGLIIVISQIVFILLGLIHYLIMDDFEYNYCSNLGKLISPVMDLSINMFCDLYVSTKLERVKFTVISLATILFSLIVKILIKGR